MRLTKNLLAAAVLGVAAVPSVYAAYTYSATITTTVPKGSAAAVIATDKKTAVPTNVKYTPCLARVNDASTPLAPTKDKLNQDQFAFTLKYDAGDQSKEANSLRDVYLILKGPDGDIFTVKRTIAQVGATAFYRPEFALATAVVTGTTTAAYTYKENNTGGSQTETFFGGNLMLEGLKKGLWTMTLIIPATDAALDLADPSTWAAWDTAAFMLDTPWPTGAACN